MCCFRLHFSEFNVYFFKKIKNLLRFTFERNNLLCLKREKNNLSRGKIPAPPLDIKWPVPKVKCVFIFHEVQWTILVLNSFINNCVSFNIFNPFGLNKEWCNRPNPVHVSISCKQTPLSIHEIILIK